MQARMGNYYEHVCTNPKCRQPLYYSTEPANGLCLTCKSTTNSRKKKQTIPKKTISQQLEKLEDVVLIQSELLPEVVIKIDSQPVVEMKHELGFFDEFCERVNAIIQEMNSGLLVNVKIMRRVLDISSDNRSKLIFIQRALNKAVDNGILERLKQKLHRGPIYYRKK